MLWCAGSRDAGVDGDDEESWAAAVVRRHGEQGLLQAHEMVERALGREWQQGWSWLLARPSTAALAQLWSVQMLPAVSPHITSLHSLLSCNPFNLRRKPPCE